LFENQKFMRKRIPVFMILAAGIVPVEAFAHGGHGTGFLAGFTHPVFGPDHFLAIVGLALLSALWPNKTPWLPSLAFVGAMIAGAIAGISGVNTFELTEPFVLLSVFTFGLFLALAFRMSPVSYAVIGAFFGFFHGHAHGVEMPDGANIPLFFAGFTTGALLLSALGGGLSKMLKKPLVVRILGVLMVLFALWSSGRLFE